MNHSFFNYLVLPLSLFGITFIEAMGLQLILGGAGLLTLGHAAFFALGGYASGASVMYLAPYLGIHHPVFLLLLGLLSSVILSSFTACFIAIPCLRLKGDYLAIATLGFGQIIENILLNVSSLGGASGFIGIPRFFNLEVNLIIICFFALFFWFFLKRFYETGVGHSILCSREDEIVAQCFGISSEKSKLIAFILGSTITGIAGALSAHTFQFISPSAASFQKSVEILLAVVIGGMFSLRGSFVGAAILILLPEFLRFLPGLVLGKVDLLYEGSENLSTFTLFMIRFLQNSMLIFSLIVLVILRKNIKGVSSLFSKINIWMQEKISWIKN